MQIEEHTRNTRKLKVLDRIQASLAKEIEAMNEIIRDSLHTDHSLVNSIVEHYLEVKGKQIRPILVMLAARMFGEIDERVLYAAASLEMLHNATLIHDDVVDQTPLRRGRPTINAVWDNHLAVLSGDIFVSKALALGVRTGSLEILTSLSNLGTELSLGEMDQLFSARGHNLTEEAYFNIIERKTASLFVGCVRIGAQAVGARENEFENLEEYARRLGNAFQIRDDIFDYYPSDDIGKPTGHDLLEGKVTLPLIDALDMAPEEEAQIMRNILMKDDMLSKTEITVLQNFAKEYGGIESAYGEMDILRSEGMDLISEYPDCQSKRDFIEIFDYIIERKY